MSSGLSKRLELIRDEVEGQDGKRLSFRRTFFFYFFVGAIVCSFLGSLFYTSPETPTQTTPSINPHEEYLVATRPQVIDRVRWLNSSIFGPTAGSFYREFSSIVLGSFEPEGTPEEQTDIELPMWSGVSDWFGHVSATILLQAMFVIIVSWPFWILGIGIGIGYFRLFLIPEATKDILGICSRNRGPFYSGIYGPLRPNGAASATDYSCPGLACPEQAPRPQALKHPLARILKHFGAFNETNLELARIIIAYKDLPCFVEEERIIEEEPDVISPLAPQGSPVVLSPVRTNEDGTIEQSSIEGLEAVLSAHRLLVRYYRAPELRDLTETDDEDRFSVHRTRLTKVSQQLKPLAQSLLLALTPARGRALANLPATVVASAYLSTEAGKSLVFKRDVKAFIQISRFPHLQARAVIQSLLPYHTEYPGDTRMVIRQAILCARRHGDFGRAFLPVSMHQDARALRDWLEILYAANKKRVDVANIVELDGHIEEIHNNFRNELSRRLEKMIDEPAPLNEDVRATLWKGLPFKSVVLLPLGGLVEIALRGISKERITRIGELMQLTRKLQASLSISARLPGFKRQAVEAEKGGLESGGVTKQLAEDTATQLLVERWLIVRRMLTRYNWLSTRIGDDAVPVDGLVQGLLLVEQEGQAREIIALPALVPVRQRRFRELFGARWEQVLYSGTPHQNSIETFVRLEDYAEGLKTRREQLARGQLNLPSKSLNIGGN